MHEVDAVEERQRGGRRRSEEPRSAGQREVEVKSGEHRRRQVEEGQDAARSVGEICPLASLRSGETQEEMERERGEEDPRQVLDQKDRAPAPHRRAGRGSG